MGLERCQFKHVALTNLSCFRMLLAEQQDDRVAGWHRSMRALWYICCFLQNTYVGRAMDAKFVSPPLMAHRTRVDRMTNHDNECNEAWDREWTASPTYERVRVYPLYGLNYRMHRCTHTLTRCTLTHIRTLTAKSISPQFILNPGSKRQLELWADLSQTQVKSPWKSSLGKTSQEFLADSRCASTRAETKRLMVKTSHTRTNNEV